MHRSAHRVVVRRRGRALEQAIFEATLDQMVASGYARLSMEAVAAAAQTGKASLYRRWGSKEQLVLDVLQASLPPAGEPPDSGSLREDLLTVLERLRAAMSSRSGCAARAVISELDHERAAAFIGLVHQRILEPAHSLLLQVVQAAAARGETRADAATPMVLDVVPAMMMYRAKTGQGRFTEQEAVALVDEVLLPVLRAGAPGSPRPASGEPGSRESGSRAPEVHGGPSADRGAASDGAASDGAASDGAASDGAASADGGASSDG